MECICLICGKKFINYYIGRKYCSMKCYNTTKSKSKLTKTCLICKKQFKVIPSRIEAKYCSKKCMGESLIGKHLPFERCKNISESLKGNKSSSWKGGEVIIKCKICGDEKSIYRAKFNSRKENSFYCSNECAHSDIGLNKIRSEKTKKNWLNEEIKSKMLSNWGSSVKFKDTSPELIVLNDYISKGYKEGVDIIKQKYIKNVGKVDFYLHKENTLIFVDGDYWHCNPEKYKPCYYNSRVCKFAFDIWQRDNTITSICKELGYKVIRMWERDINFIKNMYLKRKEEARI